MRRVEKPEIRPADLKGLIIEHILNNRCIMDMTESLTRKYHNALLDEVTNISFTTYSCDCGQRMMDVICDQICEHLCQMLDDLRCINNLRSLRQCDYDDAVHILRQLICTIRSLTWN